MLYLACERAHQVAAVSIESRQIVRSFQLSETPTGLILLDDPPRLLVTCSGKRSQAVYLDALTGRILNVWPGGYGMCSPIADKTRSTVYACNRYENTVSFLDMHLAGEFRRAAVTREPIAASLSPDGQTLAVANLLPVGSADKTVVHAAVALLDTGEDAPLTQVNLPNGSTSVRALVFHPKENVCAVVHSIALPGPSHAGREWLDECQCFEPDLD
jgi:hypothetical protein